MLADAFFFEMAMAQDPPTLSRPQVQQQARLLTELAPRPDQAEQPGALAYPAPGRGVSGESQN